MKKNECLGSSRDDPVRGRRGGREHVGLVLIDAASGWWDREGAHNARLVCVGDFL